ncbi:uncharacterized protein [Cherax quadricarinatus]
MLVAAAVGQKPELPDIWTVVEDSYDSDVTVTFASLEPGVTMNVDELYDIGEEKGVLRIVDHGHYSKTNYYTLTQQTYVVQDRKCSVGSIIEHVGYRIWGWLYDDSHSSEGKQNFLFGPSALLRIARDYKDQADYIGQTLVRGIMADHWVIKHDDNHTLDFHFAIDDWLMPYGHELEGVKLAAPLLVKVNGKQGNPWNPAEGEIDQEVFYEYTDFKPYVANNRKFEFLVQDGLECKGRETMDPSKIDPPKIPSDNFQVFIETLVPSYDSIQHQVKTTIFRAWMYYDNYKQLLRLDINPDMDAVEQTQAYKSIHDFNTGIEYRIYMETGACDMQPLDPDQLGNVIGSGVIAGVIMADPDNLFHLDDSYFFNGYGETRGIRTDRWTSTRNDIKNPDTGENYMKAVVDYQFIYEGTEIDGETIGTSLPASIDVTVYNDSDPDSILYRHIVNLLHFKTSFETFEINPFDVRECMDTPPQRTWIKFTFKGDWFQGASQEPDAFQRALLSKISTSGTSFVRLPEIRLDHDTNFVYATLLLLEPAPYHFQFERLEDTKPTDSDTQLEMSIEDVDECALQCLRYVRFQCVSFYECQDLNKNCFVSNYKDSPGNFVDIPKNCSHYKKALIKNTKIQKTNDEVLLWLDGQVSMGIFVLRIKYQDIGGQTKTGIYNATFVEEILMPDDPILVDLIREDFQMAFIHGKLQAQYTDLQLNKVSYDLCLASCLQERAFDCETFSYCYDDSTCSLSSFVVDSPVPNSEVVRKTNCVIISRSHTNDYDKMDGTVFLGTPKASTHTTGPEKCAFYCDNSTAFTCRSFDFCSQDNTCNLFEEHSIDVPDKLNHSYADCVHYARNALVDFKKHEKQVLAGNRDRYVKDISVTQCAQVCEDEPDFGCNGFDYCTEPGSITCFLTSAHYSDAGIVITNSPTCDHYSREYYEGDDRDSHANRKKDPSKYIYGPGDMAGLACSMLVISIALTFAGVYAYNKHYKQ